MTQTAIPPNARMEALAYMDGEAGATIDNHITIDEVIFTCVEN